MSVGNILNAVVPVHRRGKWEDRPKLFLCVDSELGWYFYFNSGGHWHGSFAISCARDNVLDKDCYVGCGQLQELDESNFLHPPLGRLTKQTLTDIAQFLPTVQSLTDEEKDQIIANLLNAT